MDVRRIFIILRMYFVYIIRDEKNNFYKGFAEDLEKRLHQHRSGLNKSTSKSKLWELVYTESFEKIEEAVKREKYFKSAAGRRFIKFKLNLR